MLMLIVWAANLLIIAFALAFAWVGSHFGIEFALGGIVVGSIYNIAHRVLYGRWL